MWRGDWSSEPAVQWTHEEGQFGVAKITEKGNVTHDPILRPICQTILDLTLCDPKRRKELELWGVWGNSSSPGPESSGDLDAAGKAATVLQGLTQEAVRTSGRWRCRNQVHKQERDRSQDALRIPTATATVGGAKEQWSSPGAPPTYLGNCTRWRREGSDYADSAGDIR